MLEVLDMLAEFDIQQAFEDALNEKRLMNDVGYFTSSVERDDDGSLFIQVRVAAMVDTAGTEDFVKNEELSTIRVVWPEESVNFKVVEVVNVSGMENEVIYKPFPVKEGQ